MLEFKQGSFTGSNHVAPQQPEWTKAPDARVLSVSSVEPKTALRRQFVAQTRLKFPLSGRNEMVPRLMKTLVTALSGSV